MEETGGWESEGEDELIVVNVVSDTLFWIHLYLHFVDDTVLYTTKG